MSQVIPSYRVLLKATEIAALVDVLSVHKAKYGMSSEATDALKKLIVFNAKVEAGVKSADYVPTGTKAIAIKNLTADDLGGYNDSLTEGANVAANLFSSKSSNNTQQSKPSADLTAEEEAFLLAEEKRMLESVAGNGAGSENVIPERRKTPRTIQETYTTDDL